MQSTINFIKALTAFEMCVVLTIALTVAFMFAVIIWEIANALDRATKTIIKILYVPLSRVAYFAVQVLVLAFTVFAVCAMLSPQFQYELYWKLRSM
jgi:hypothetical protein